MATIPKNSSRNEVVKNSTRLEVLQYIILVCILLYFGKTLFIPLSFAFLISFILYPICKWMEQKGFHPIAAIAISLTSVAVVFTSLLLLLFYQFMEFSYKTKKLPQ
jgi:predicted PurR-regulated permease PerM